MRTPLVASVVVAVAAATLAAGGVAQTGARKYVAADGQVRVALVKQPLSPNGPSKGPTTMAEGGIQGILSALGATVRVDEARLTPEEETEYGGWKKLGLSLGHFADLVARNERDGYFTVGLLATCPSMPGLVAGLQRSGPTLRSAPHRHALARRASRLQHARDDAERIAGRHAGGRRHRPRPAGHAARRHARPAAGRSATW